MVKGKDGLDGVCEEVGVGVGVQITESLDLFCVGILIGRSNVFFVLQVYQALSQTVCMNLALAPSH